MATLLPRKLSERQKFDDPHATAGPLRSRIARAGLAAWLLFLLAGCARVGNFAEERADKAAYTAIEQKTTEAGLEYAMPFTIDTTLDEATKRLLAETKHLGWAQDSYSTPTYVLSLADTLAIALSNSRAYQTRKETMFQRALELTRTRYDFGAQFSASASGRLTRTESGNGTPEGANVEVFGGYGFSAGVRRFFATGAEVSLEYTHDFVRFLTNSPRPSGENAISLSVVQPLLRGFGPLVAHEGLRQAERNMIYEVRDFRRYQQNFIITVADRFYGLLRSRDQVRNAENDFLLAQDNWDQLQLLRDAGQRSDLEVDQARQRVLQAENAVTNSQASYMTQLDRFKLFLGLPLDLDLGPDPRELELLTERGLIRPAIELEDAIEIALAERLDLKTVEDRVDDADRGVRIALRNFLPDLDFSYGFRSARLDDSDEFSLDLRNNRHVFGLDLGLPFDWTPRRNLYRRALIFFEQAKRGLEEEKDSVALDVRENWRQLERLRQNYNIQMESVRLAERRVDSTQMLLQANRASTRDVLEALDSLVSSQNALTDALVSYTIQRLRFWDSIERLTIDSKGMWYE